METRTIIERSPPDPRRTGLFFLVMLLAIAFFPSIVSELKAWSALQSLADSMLRAIPALAAMDVAERSECSAPTAPLFQQQAADLPTIAAPRLPERALLRRLSRSRPWPSPRQVSYTPSPRGPPLAS
jgi:hypothetical protein